MAEVSKDAVPVASVRQAYYPPLHVAPSRALWLVPAPQFATKGPAAHQSSGATSLPAALPVRSPGAHLHPQLRRPPEAGRWPAAGDAR